MRFKPFTKRYLILIFIAISLQTGVITQGFAQAQQCTPFDNFENSTQISVPFILTTNSPGPVTVLDDGSPGVRGGFREVEFGPLISNTVSVATMIISGNRLSLNTDLNGTVDFSILYDANGAGLNLDLSGVLSFAVGLNTSDLPDTDMTITISDSANNTADFVILNLPNLLDGDTLPVNLQFPIAQFNGIGSVDLADIFSILIEVNPTQEGNDITLTTADICSSVGPSVAVPTLSEWALIIMTTLFGITGLMMIRRKKTTAKYF